MAAVSAGTRNNYRVGIIIAEIQGTVGMKNNLYLVEGIQLVHGLNSQYFTINSENMSVEFENCKVREWPCVDRSTLLDFLSVTSSL